MRRFKSFFIFVLIMSLLMPSYTVHAAFDSDVINYVANIVATDLRISEGRRIKGEIEKNGYSTVPPELLRQSMEEVTIDFDAIESSVADTYYSLNPIKQFNYHQLFEQYVDTDFQINNEILKDMEFDKFVENARSDGALRINGAGGSSIGGGASRVFGGGEEDETEPTPTPPPIPGVITDGGLNYVQRDYLWDALYQFGFPEKYSAVKSGYLDDYDYAYLIQVDIPYGTEVALNKKVDKYTSLYYLRNFYFSDGNSINIILGGNEPIPQDSICIIPLYTDGVISGYTVGFKVDDATKTYFNYYAQYSFYEENGVVRNNRIATPLYETPVNVGGLTLGSSDGNYIYFRFIRTGGIDIPGASYDFSSDVSFTRFRLYDDDREVPTPEPTPPPANNYIINLPDYEPTINDNSYYNDYYIHEADQYTTVLVEGSTNNNFDFSDRSVTYQDYIINSITNNNYQTENVTVINNYTEINNYNTGETAEPTPTPPPTEPPEEPGDPGEAAEGYFTGFFSDIYDALTSRFGFIAQISDAMEAVSLGRAVTGESAFGPGPVIESGGETEVQEFSGEGTSYDVYKDYNNYDVPVFEFTLPERYGGGTYQLVDFSYFAEYRLYIFNFVRFIAWFIFFKRTFRYLPNIIYR